MLAHPTLDRLNAMGLAGMARAFDELATMSDGMFSFTEKMAALI